MPFVRLEGPPGAEQGGRKFVVLEKSKDPRASDVYKREKAKARERDKLRRDVSSKGIAGFGGRRTGALLDSIMPLPVGDEIRGGMFALGNEAVNLARRATGRDTVDSRAIYLANKDAENELTGQRRKEFPVTSTTGEVLAGTASKPAQAAVKAAPAIPVARSLADKAVTFGKNASMAGAGGGMFGLLHGAADDEGMGRIENGLEAVLPGAIAGAGAFTALSALSPLVKAAPKVAADIKRGLTSRPPSPGVRPVASPAQAERAATAVERIAMRQGMTPEAVRQIADDVYKGKPVTAAEILGREGVTQLAATARRAGSTADELEALLRARQAGAGPRILEDAERTLRVSPAAAAGSIDDIVEKGQARAAPLYERALGGDPPIWNNELANLSGRPVVKEAMRTASTSLRNAGKNPEALGLGFVDTPDAFMSTTPPPFDAPDLPRAAPRGPSRAPSQGKSLLKFISEGRGITDAADELAAMDALQWHRGKAYARPLAGDGASLDDWAVKAWEQGYFPQHQSRPTERELLDAIRQELRGKPVYARQADPAAQSRFDAREAFDELAYRGGDPADLPTPEQYVGRPEPGREPAFQAEPTAAAWDHVKKALHTLVERDRVTGQVIRTGKVGVRNRDIEAAARDMRIALAGDKGRPGAIPGYREALDASGDYLSVQSAYNRAQGSLMRGSVRDFGRVWGSAKTPAEREAVRAAMANDLLVLAERGHLRGGKFAVPGLQQKLDLAFGKKGAQAFLVRMEAEAALARSTQRMMPGAGSPTMELAEAAGDQGSALGDVARVTGKAVTGQGGNAAMDAITSVFNRIGAYAKTVGVPVEVRDEFGRLLSMSADDFAKFLQTRKPQAVRGPDGAWIFPAQLGGRIAGQSASMSE